jgi:XTP/dITP diphosphohydrolase
MDKIVFVTHNKGKIETAKEKLKDVNFVTYDYELSEPRSDDISLISKVKVMEAYEIVKCPCISMDSGFIIDSLNGFPKAFVNFALDTIGITGILKLMKGKKNRKCRFTECLSYYDGVNLHQFYGYHEGHLATSIRGNDTDKKWSSLWYIFMPYGYKKTLAEMSDLERLNRKPYKSISSFDKFCEWYKEVK